MVFGAFDFLQKTNENKSIWGIVVVRFLEEIEDIKNLFEINWPWPLASKYVSYLKSGMPEYGSPAIPWAGIDYLSKP